MIHLLHLVHDWVQVIHEVGRVTKKVMVLEAGDAEGFSPRQRYLEKRDPRSLLPPRHHRRTPFALKYPLFFCQFVVQTRAIAIREL